MEEIWKPCPFAEGSHMVSNLGRVKKLAHLRVLGIHKDIFRPERIIKQSIDTYGYPIVGLRNERIKSKTKTVHRLVALAFINQIEGKTQVNHIDGNKRNNRIDNLEWVNQSENMIHSIYVLGNLNKLNPRIGQESGMSKLTDEQVIEIMNSKESRNALCAKFNVSKTTILDIQNGLSWHHLQKHKDLSVTRVSPLTKFSDSLALEVLKTEGSCKEVGKKFGLNHTTVWNIRRGHGKWARLHSKPT